MTLLIVDLPTDMYCKKRSKILKSINVFKKVYKEASEAFYNLSNFTNIFFRNIAEVHVVECLLGGHVGNATLKGITTWLSLLFIAQCKLMINLLITFVFAKKSFIGVSAYSTRKNNKLTRSKKKN